MKLYIYRNSEIGDENHYPEPVEIVEADTDTECLRVANEKYESNDYTFSFVEPPSNLVVFA